MFQFRQGEEVTVKDKGLYQVGKFIQNNEDGTLRVRIGKKGLDVKPYFVEHRRKPERDEDERRERE